MKRTRHTPQQIIGKLREAEAMQAAGLGLAEVCRKLQLALRLVAMMRCKFGPNLAI